MVIEIKKKHVLIAVVGLVLGIAIGVGAFSLFYSNTKEVQSIDMPTKPVETVTETPKQTSVQTTTPVSESAVGTSLYSNGRYGFSVKYPNTWTKGPTPANGDGISISPQDGSIELTVSGSNNVLHRTVQNEYYASLNSAKQQGIPGFHTVSDDWYVVTYTDGTFIYYIKGFVGSGSINTLRIKYLASMKEQYADTIQGLEDTFNHGNLEVTH